MDLSPLLPPSPLTASKNLPVYGSPPHPAVASHSTGRIKTVSNSRTISTSGRAPRCRRMRAALAVVSRQSLAYYHLVTWSIQVTVLLIISIAGDSSSSHSALGLTKGYVYLIVCLEILEAGLTLFVLSGVLVHIKALVWRTSDLAWLWLVTTIAFAAVYMTIAISYDSLLCDGTQPCTYFNETWSQHSRHHSKRPVPMPQLTSNVSFEYPSVWLKVYSQNVSHSDNLNLEHGSKLVFSQLRLEMKHGVSGALLLFLQFWYYSVQMQTQVGIGDVIPVCWLARCVAMFQMLIGVLFSATLVSLTLDSFRLKRKTYKLEQREKLNRLRLSMGRSSVYRPTVPSSLNTGSYCASENEINQALTKHEVEIPIETSLPLSKNLIYEEDEDEDEDLDDDLDEDLDEDPDHDLVQLNDQYCLKVENGTENRKENETKASGSENVRVFPTLDSREVRDGGWRQGVHVTPNQRTFSYGKSRNIDRSSRSTIIDSFPPGSLSPSSSVGWGTWLCGGTATSKFRAFRRFMRRWLLLVTLLGQSLHLLWLYIVDDNLFADGANKKNHLFVGNTTLALVSMVIQILLVMSVVATALVYVRHSERITLNYLCQAFLSICIHFSGIYIMIFLFQGKSSWPTVGVAEDNVNGDSGGISVRNEGFWGTAYRFLYVSIALMTTTGCNSLSPKSEIAIVAVTLQMIISFLFLAVILALGVSLVNSERSKDRKSLDRKMISLSARKGAISTFD